MKNIEELEQTIVMLNVSVIILTFTGLILVATIFAITRRKELTQLNDTIDLQSKHIRKVENRNNVMKSRIKELAFEMEHGDITFNSTITHLKDLVHE